MKKIIGLLIGGTLAAATMSTAFAAAPAPASDSVPAATASPTGHHATARHASMSRKHVEAIQEALNANGEKVAVDGIMGAKTRTALKQYQHKNGLKATGHPDAATLEHLKVS